MFKNRRDLTLWTIVRWELLAAACLLVLLVVAYAPSFHECIASPDQYAHYEGEKLNDSVRWTTPLVLWVLLRCGGLFIDANNGTLTALATIVLAIFTYTLWQVGSGQLNEIRRQQRQAKADSERQAIDMSAMLAATTEANEIARETSRSECRAYIVVRSVWLELYSTNTRIEVEIANTGQTPARWVEFEGNARYVPDQTAIASEVVVNFTGPTKSRWAVDPGKEGRRFPCPTDATDGRDTLQTALAAMDRYSFLVQGTVRWETMFGEIFESTFFAWNVPRLRRHGPDDELIPQQLAMPSGVETITCRQTKWAEED